MNHTLGRPDFAVIAGWVEPGHRVLDLGCGDGTLLKHLIDTRGVRGVGVEIDDANVLAALKNGINIIQGNNILPVNTSSMANGAYIIKVQLTDDVVIRKFNKM